jgi:prephenate dehydratase
MRQTIAYLGPAGTWSETAALLYGESGAELLSLASMPAVVSAIETGLAEVGVLPVENSLEGAVPATLDVLIHETELQIAAEVVVPIRHMLVANPGAGLADIAVLHVHPQSLGQCRRFVERVLPKVTTVAALSNTAAVEELLNDPRGAAITTPRATEIYPVQVLAHDIQDEHTNQTRFIVLAASDSPPTGQDKTSLCFSVQQNTPGSLVKALQIFAAKGINLAKLESRPARERLGQYIFLCDLEGHHDEPRVAEALEELAAQADWIKIFGSYPVWSEPSAFSRQPSGIRPQPTMEERRTASGIQQPTELKADG